MIAQPKISKTRTKDLLGDLDNPMNPHLKRNLLNSNINNLNPTLLKKRELFTQA